MRSASLKLFGSFGAASDAKSTKKSERLGGRELFGLVGDVGGAKDAKDPTAALRPMFYGALIGDGSDRTGLFTGYHVAAAIMIFGGDT